MFYTKSVTKLGDLTVWFETTEPLSVSLIDKKLFVKIL